MINKCLKNNKAFTLIEFIIVMAIIGILVLLASPKFLDYVNKAKLTQIINDSKVAENYTITYKAMNNSLPKGEFLTKDKVNLNTKGKTMYFEGKIISNLDGFSEDDLYLLDKDNLVKEINTKLKGQFIYTDLGVIYIDNIINNSNNKLNDSGFIYDEKNKSIIGWDDSIEGPMPENIIVPKTIIKNGKEVVVEKVEYNFEKHNLKSITIDDGIKEIKDLYGNGNNLKRVHIGNDVKSMGTLVSMNILDELYLGKNLEFNTNVNGIDTTIPTNTIELNKQNLQNGRWNSGKVILNTNKIANNTVVRNITVHPEAKNIKIKDGFLIANNRLLLLTDQNAFNNMIDNNLILPQEITVLSSDSVFGNKNVFLQEVKDVKNITLPNNLYEIEELALELSNTQITNLNIKSNALKIGANSIMNKKTTPTNINITANEIHSRFNPFDIESGKIILDIDPQKMFLSRDTILKENVYFIGNTNLPISKYPNNVLQYYEKYNYISGFYRFANTQDKNGLILVPTDLYYIASMDDIKNNKFTKLNIDYEKMTIGENAFSLDLAEAEKVKIHIKKDDLIKMSENNTLSNIMKDNGSFYKQFEQYGNDPIGVYTRVKSLGKPWSFNPFGS